MKLEACRKLLSDRRVEWYWCQWGFPGGSVVKNPMQEMQIRSVGWEDTLEKEMATHPSILAWEIPWTEVRGGL